MVQVQIQLFDDKESLLREAELQANKSQDPNLKTSIKLYFIARYFVAVYESRWGEIPIQVWNEYRNALDHFFRQQTGGSPAHNVNMHLESMEGHLRRAALDILKLLCHRTQDSIQNQKDSFAKDVIRLVDNGQFILELNELINRAQEQFTRAKVSDLRLGADAQTNSELLELYLDAAFSFDIIQLKLLNRNADIESAQRNHDFIAKKAGHASFWQEYGRHAFYGISVFFIGWFAETTYEYYKSNFSSKVAAEEVFIDEQTVSDSVLVPQNESTVLEAGDQQKLSETLKNDG